MRFLGHGSSIHGSDLAGQRIVPIEEPDALVAHVRFWGEGGGAIPSLTRQLTGSCSGLMTCGSVWDWNLGASLTVSRRAVQLSAQPLGALRRSSRA